MHSLSLAAYIASMRVTYARLGRHDSRAIVAGPRVVAALQSWIVDAGDAYLDDQEPSTLRSSSLIVAKVSA